MNSGVGAAGCDERGLLAGHAFECLLERLLDGGPVVLALPPHERAAVIFDRQTPAGHARIVPSGIGNPRSSSPGVIADRPARWTKSARTYPSPAATLRQSSRTSPGLPSASVPADAASNLM